jgi:cellulose biosynthesis protein BcsQ
MDNEVLRYFLTQGPFAILFVWLLIYVMKANKEREAAQAAENRERESRLQSLLEKFSDKYDVIIADLREIKSKVTDSSRKQ